VFARLEPSDGALEAARLLAGPSAQVTSVVSLVGGQHAATWKVDTVEPERAVVVRQFPVGDPAAADEERVLGLLNGLGGLCPVLLSCDLDHRWSPGTTVITSWLDGEAEITPADPTSWATQLGQALATVHSVLVASLSTWSSVFDRGSGNREQLTGPAAEYVESNWSRVLAAPEVLTHGDYWSGNVVWHDGALTGIVDWSGAGRGPRGFDIGWCRLDLFLLFNEQVADVFLAAYQQALGEPLADMALWDSWAAARSHDHVTSWAANYQPLGREDLDSALLRHRHQLWTALLLERV
jgi:aminoglycoside phosphotransferase (APT) family kinase protein